MRILFLSKLGDGLGVADRLAQEGHDIRFWSKDLSYIRDLKGLVSRVDSWRPSVLWADFIICDMVGFSQHKSTFDRYAKPSFSCNAFADVIELDRLKGLRTARAAGMEAPESWSFSSVADAREHKVDSPVVVKPSNNLNAGQTRICPTPDHYHWALDQLGGEQDILVQRVVEGTEVSTEGWFNGIDWIKPFNHTFEEKRLMPGSGLNTGCMGNLVVRTAGDRLTEATVEKMAPYLRKAGYRGPIDINCIINGEHAYFLEFTARMGYDAIEALATGLKEPLAGLLFETATGTKKEMDLTDDYMIAVRLCMPPYPFKGKAEEGVPLSGVEEWRKFLFLSGVMKRDGKYVTSGSDGVVAKVTARGRSLDEVRRRVYRTLEGIKGIDLYYRPDIGQRAGRDIRQLVELGWLAI